MNTLKNTLLAIGALTLLVSPMALRAEDTQKPADAATLNAKKEGAKNQMAEKLGLTEDQKTKMKPIWDEMKAKAKEIKNNESLNKTQKREQMKALRESYEPKIKAILTPEQQKQFDQIKAERKAKFEAKRAEWAAKKAQDSKADDSDTTTPAKK